MRQYHTEDRRDHWKFRSGSLPGVNECRQEHWVASTGNNHGREGEAQRCTASRDIDVFVTANVPQAQCLSSVIRTPFGTNVVGSADSFYSRTCGGDAHLNTNPLLYVSSSLENFQDFPCAHLFSPFLAHFPFSPFIELFSLSITLLVLHLRFRAVNLQFTPQTAEGS